MGKRLPKPTINEQKVLDLVIRGFTNKQIGFRLGRSEDCIKTQLRVITKHTGLQGRVLLAIAYYRWRYQNLPVKGWHSYASFKDN